MCHSAESSEFFDVCYVVWDLRQQNSLWYIRTDYRPEDFMYTFDTSLSENILVFSTPENLLVSFPPLLEN
jgi:hypothetical protein